MLFGLMQRMGLVERVGSGIHRMRESMADYGLKSPQFEIDDNWFSLILQRQGERLGEKLGESEKRIIGFILDNEKITIKLMPVRSKN